MIRAKLLSLLAVVFGSIIGLAQPVAASTLTFDLNFEFSGATAPKGTAPWISATFSDDGVASGTVELTLDVTNLIGSEFVGQWLFNYNGSAAPTASTSTIAFTYETGSNVFKADGDGYFDIRITFDAKDFGSESSDTLIIVLSSSDFGTANDTAFFDDLSATGMGGGPGPFRSAAHVQGIVGGESGWIGDDPDLEIPVVPLPAAAWLFGSALVGLIGMSRIRKRRRA